ncbi:MAG: site-specific DNA-methyltransferase [Candidatus Omnitrophica bacterium]|nr:site-specific DNA-methyltransferase [Candidatus Omnitrophota bacterium]
MLESNTCYNDKCEGGLSKLEDNSVDLITTDPPYGYGFMGRQWDKALVSVDTWRECLRVLKPGAFAFIMSAPRQDVLSRMIVNIGDAGFKTDFTSICWVYASGFPKAMNISKAVEKKFGVESVDAKALDGAYAGFQPKPGVEIVIVAMKPLAEGSYVDQALANGKGITWLDDGRIPFQSGKDVPGISSYPDIRNGGVSEGDKMWISASNRSREVLEGREYSPSQKGRFPSNILVCDDALNDGIMRKGGGSIVTPPSGRFSGLTYNGGIATDGDERPFDGYDDEGSASRYFDLDAWWEERIESMDPAVLETFPFLLVPKASTSEKNTGLTEKNPHPTVKPVKLFNYLITLGSRKGDIVLDPFGGSGTTGVAAEISERDYILFEMEQDFHDIACKRIEHQQKITKRENPNMLSKIFKMKC